MLSLRRVATRLGWSGRVPDLRRVAARLRWSGGVPDLRQAARRLGPRAQFLGLVLAVAAACLAMGAVAPDDDAKPPANSAGGRQLAAVSAPEDQLDVGQRHWPLRAAAEHYRRTARKHVAPKGAKAFLPLYREASRVFRVNWRLIASVHRQETAFSTASTTYHGLNDFGCCAGPMQFNVTNGPVSTWESYRNAFRKGNRPERYPHRTRKHPSIYDDFDAIMAAGSLLSDSGAGSSLDSAAWSAAYSYYGHDLYGVTYASQVLARAVAWERDGFCPNCEVDEGLVSRFDRMYGEPVRRQLMAEELRRKKLKKHKKRRRDKGDRHERRKRDALAKERERERERARARDRRASRPKKAEPSPPRARGKGTKPAQPPTPAAPTQPPAPSAPAPAPAPPARACAPLEKLLGCKP